MKMKMFRFATFILSLLLFGGCTKTVKTAELNSKISARQGNSFPDKGFYIGSARGFDYFEIRSGLNGSSRRYRVRESESAVSNRFPLTKDQRQWRPFPFGFVY
jgi:hypothetical protein